MTYLQFCTVDSIVRGYKLLQVHHGGCKGADLQFDIICSARCAVAQHVIHPGPHGIECPCRAHQVRQKKPYLERNKHIVEECGTIIATPAGFKEELRSGTWATIREVLRADRNVPSDGRRRELLIVYPNGDISTTFKSVFV